jgi:hypothetical protein
VTAAWVVLLAVATGIFVLQRERVIDDVARISPARLLDAAARAWLRRRARTDVSRLARSQRPRCPR